MSRARDRATLPEASVAEETPASEAEARASAQVEQKEGAVKETRHWVRITRYCNNNCRFCLDADSLNRGGKMPGDEIEADIRRGRERGAERLILSGGEASIDPRFISYVRLGRELGYTWIQTISNGRVFSYGKFVAAAVRAGLNEVTLSIHGHNAELHDHLCGIPGAFDQVMAGLTHLRRIPGFVVNIDVVLNRKNVPHLREMLEFFIDKGVREFDLLHLVPFGRAWGEHRAELYYAPDEMAHHLARAFALRHETDLVIWTNRLPAELLEGEEDLIQDPHKLHDEVNGRREMFGELVREGRPLSCKGDRCEQCHLQRFCRELEQLRQLWAEGGARGALLDTEGLDAGLAGRFVEEARRRLETSAEDFQLVVQLSSAEVLEWPVFQSRAPEALEFVGHRLQDLDAVFASGLPTVVSLTTDLLRSVGEDESWSTRAAGLRFPSFEYLSEALEGAPALDEGIRSLAPLDLPACLGGRDDGRSAELFPLGVIDPETWQIDPVRFTDYYIRELYRVKSLRCAACAEAPRCPGLHINHIRRWGFAVLSPLDALSSQETEGEGVTIPDQRPGRPTTES